LSDHELALEKLSPAPPLWRDRFEAIAACTLQGQLVHRAFAPLWANAAFADIFGFDTVEDALAAPSLAHLFDDAAQADCRALAAAAGARRVLRGRFGRRLMRRRDGAVFHAEIYARRVLWDGDWAVAVAVRELPGSPLPRARGAILIAVSAADRAPIRRALRRIGFWPLIFVDSVAAAPAPVAAAVIDIGLPDARALVDLARRCADVPVVAVASAPPDAARLQARLQALGVDAFVEKRALGERLGEVLALLTRHAPPNSVEAPERRDIEDEDEGDEPADDIDRDHV
jgi:hypothetical protein